MSSGSYPDADGGDLFESTWEPLEFDSSLFGDARAFDTSSDLLPTRWDALGSPPAELDDPPDPIGFRLDAPATDEPPLTAAVFEPLSIDDGGSTMYDDAYRVCFRLTGVRALAHELAARAIRETAAPGGPAGMIGAVMTAAVEGALGADIGDGDRVAYAQHRARLRRDLGRYSDRDRAILALRHLVGVPPVAVAARLGLQESVVREVASAWWPEDSRGDSSALLRGIDSWIHAEAADDEVAPGSEHLAHLDDTAPDS